MKRNAARLTGMSAALVLGLASQVHASQMMLSISGLLGGYPFADMQPEEATTIGGDPLLAPNKPFTFEGWFDTTITIASPWAGDNLYPVSGFTLTVGETTYTGTPSSNVNVFLRNMSYGGTDYFEVGITDTNGSANWDNDSNATPTGIIYLFTDSTHSLDITAPTPYVFSGAYPWCYSGPYNIPLAGVPGGLQINDNPNGYAVVYPDGSNTTAFLSAVPEPASLSLLGLGGLLMLRRRR